ncbi:MAG: hypothetical protein RLZZ09_3242 [Pseudomonadota bacterium]|jgi:hypothetical protein
MTDRELLEVAARAAGIDLLRGPYITWNPLTDDGDALRLAVCLWITVTQFTKHVRAEVDGQPDLHEPHGPDPYAATRRAIVRAAAEIGRSMK